MTDTVMQSRRSGCVQMPSGILRNVLDPVPEEIRLSDIAYNLASQVRFAGGSRPRYTVAEHSVWVSLIVPREYAAVGLLHDATEGLGLVDVPRPIKHLPEMAEYRALEQLNEECVAKRFGLPYPWPKEVRDADEMLLAAECRQLMRVDDAREWWGELATRELPPVVALCAPFFGMSPETAEVWFLARAAQLGIR